MTSQSLLSLEDARSFVRNVEIDPPRGVRAAVSAELASAADLPKYSDGHQAVVVGSQIAEFAAGLPAELRPHISNAFLLAQLAARKAVATSGGGPAEWFDAYIGVLASIGWVQEGIATASHEVSGDTLRAQKEIVAVITAALGPAAASASIVLSALNGLTAISKNSPWITIFDTQSQTRTAYQFQMAYARGDAAKMAAINLAYFELSATATLSQALFFRFSSMGAVLRHRECAFSLNATIFDQLKGDIEDRIAKHLRAMVCAIEI